jgi:hypothetical protein
MPKYYVYADARAHIVATTTTNPPATGGIVFGELETDEVDVLKRQDLVAQLMPSLRLQNERGETLAARPTSSAGLDEILTEATAHTRAHPSIAMQLVGGADVVLRRWP